MNIQTLAGDLASPDTSPEAKHLVMTVNDLLAAIKKRNGLKQRQNTIEQNDAPYDPSPIVQDATKSYPTERDLEAAPQVPDRYGPGDLSVLDKVGALQTLSNKAGDVDQQCDSLSTELDGLVVQVAMLLRQAIDKDQLSGLSEEQLQALLIGIARLVAKKDVEGAIEDIEKQISDLDTESRQQDAYNYARGRDVSRYTDAIGRYYEQEKACGEITQEFTAFLQSDPEALDLLNKLNRLPEESAQRLQFGPPPAPLLPRPRLETGNPGDNRPVLTKINSTAAERVFGAPIEPDDVQNYSRRLQDAYRGLGRNVEDFALKVLRARVDAYCSSRTPPLIALRDFKTRLQSL
jgi:hypothetical protein